MIMEAISTYIYNAEAVNTLYLGGTLNFFLNPFSSDVIRPTLNLLEEAKVTNCSTVASKPLFSWYLSLILLIPVLLIILTIHIS